MATIINQTNWSFTKSTGVTTQTVTIPATTAGSKLVLFCAGGATVTAKITNTSGAAFNVRANLASGQGISWHDFTSVGGETAVFLTLNGAENISGTIFEVTGLGAFVAGSTGGAITPGNANDQQCKPTAANLGANANGVLFGGWTVTATAASNPFNLSNQWRQMGPYGALKVNAGNQPGANTQFIYAAGVADITSAARYPLDAASAGDYRATSVWINSTGNTYAAQVLYADTSGTPINPSPANPIVAENSMPGTNQANWFLTAAGSTNANIAGYTDKVSYAPGDTVNFKVDSGNGAFRVEVYRLGYYGWETHGARLMTGNAAGYITGSPAVQGAPSVDGTLGSTSCAWSTTATWAIPSDAPPGVYHVLYRSTVTQANVATGMFIVRSSSAAGKTAVVLPCMTYAAYNLWGATNNTGTLAAGTWSARSLYTLGTDGASTNFAHRAYAVSFDRPWGTQTVQSNTWLFDAEYGLIHFMEAQGYNLTYLADVDLDSNTTQLNTAALVALLGHHEYWTTGVYDCITHAVDAGVNMFVDSSNTALWHVRFAAGDTNKRTVICYKDSATVDNAAGFTGTGLDPVSYTGTWRDTRTGGSVNNTDIRSENALTGQLFRLSASINVAIGVPFAQKTLPIWRNSSGVQALTSGQTYSATFGVLGDEVDAADGSAGQPANLVSLCPTATGTQASGANANGTLYSTSVNITGGFTVYRRYSGALIFNTGSWRGWQGISRWARATLGGTVTAVDLNWQNALLAVLYDLGITPIAARELRPGTDTAPTDPATGAPVGGRSAVAIAYGLRAPEDGAILMFAA
jgi:hypothetical protein